ncbi:hypothetical protein K439DRAFT_1400057 [Ramaria rubella]|nr:hypothetical protein K439DRAFT_1400057 [Ramaria rubella]
MGHGTNASIYSRVATKARKIQAALPRMHLLFNALRTFTFIVILAWSLIVLGIAAHFQIVLVSSDLTRFVPLALFGAAFTIFIMAVLLVLSNFRKINPVSTRLELCCLALVGTVWLALGLFMATSSSQDADVECFSEVDQSLEVTSFTTDTFHAQYRVVEAFSLFNAILSWAYFLTLLVLALRHHHLGWKRVWQTSATSSPMQRRPSEKPSQRSGSLPAPVTARMVANVMPRDGHRSRQVTHHPSSRDPAPRQSSRRSPRPQQQSGGKTYVVYVPDVNRPAESHPRTHHRRTTSPARGR